MSRVNAASSAPLSLAPAGAPGPGMPTGLPPTPDAARRRRRWFAGIKSLSTVGHHRSRGDQRGDSPGPGSRSISLPEKANNVGSAAGTRPFGKPLVLSLTHDEEEDAAAAAAAASPGSPGSHSPHSPLPMSPVAAMLSARNAKLNGPALRRN
ncbi:Enolase [Frankliniella fusca]|uniref:Enolase n=1 Tax=Frankliniella fusca TaxID=407009 RepID=A0AAE1H6E3_9NEOP|nr:Enolase [Frankliniella fusca]